MNRATFHSFRHHNASALPREIALRVARVMLPQARHSGNVTANEESNMSVSRRAERIEVELRKRFRQHVSSGSIKPPIRKGWRKTDACCLRQKVRTFRKERDL